MPYRYVGQYVKVIYSAEIVEIYNENKRIAIHERLRGKHQYTTTKEHLPAKHQYFMNWSVEFFEAQAKKIGENTFLFVQQLLTTRKYAEQAYKSCAGTIALAKKVGNQRIENATERALAYDHVSLKLLQNILEKQLDNVMLFPENETTIIPLHPNIRGANYYQ